MKSTCGCCYSGPEFVSGMSCCNVKARSKNFVGEGKDWALQITPNRGGTMDHIEAVNNQAVERYLLGQMPDAEIDAFEKHFFECGSCAEEVESGVLFEENARAAFAPVPRSAPAAQRNWLSRWLSHRLSQSSSGPAFAAPALGAGVL